MCTAADMDSGMGYRRRSFESLPAWLQDARALASPDLKVVLVGNKVDQDMDRQVPYLEASRWAQENDVLFMECSSLSGEGVEQVCTEVQARNRRISEAHSSHSTAVHPTRTVNTAGH